MKVKSATYWDCGRCYGDKSHTTEKEAIDCAMAEIFSYEQFICPVCGQKFSYEDMAEECCDIELMRKKIEAIEAKEKEDFGDRIHILRMRERIEKVRKI
jgi:hypothetical protein